MYDTSVDRIEVLDKRKNNHKHAGVRLFYRYLEGPREVGWFLSLLRPITRNPDFNSITNN